MKIFWVQWYNLFSAQLAQMAPLVWLVAHRVIAEQRVTTSVDDARTATVSRVGSEKTVKQVGSRKRGCPNISSLPAQVFVILTSSDRGSGGNLVKMTLTFQCFHHSNVRVLGSFWNLAGVSLPAEPPAKFQIDMQILTASLIIRDVARYYDRIS